MPFSVFDYGRRYQEVYGKFISEPAKFSSEQISEDEARHFYAVERAWKWIIGVESHGSAMEGGTFNDVAGFAVYANGLGEYFEKRRKSQIGAFISSLLIQAYALFESLAEDLWEAAINSHPTILGELKGTSRGKFKVRHSDPGGQQKSDPSVRMSFDDLQKNRFNVGSKIGTILKRRSDIGFRSIYDIRASYHRAFERQEKAIDEILDHPQLQYAAAVRNLLVHKRGIVDKEFKEQVSGVPDVPHFTENEPFPLTGKICAELSDSCRNCSILLVNAVHAWIIGHPEKWKE
jgi:hypothetical protein